MIIDATIIGAKVSPEKDKGLIDIYWENEEGEFGHIYLSFHPDKELIISSEYMGKEFVKKVLNKLVDNAMLIE